MQETLTQISDKIEQAVDSIAQPLGITAMTAAAVVSMLEPTHELAKRMIVPEQVAFAPVEASAENNPLRREKEETGAHSVTFGVPRTQARAGRK